MAFTVLDTTTLQPNGKRGIPNKTAFETLNANFLDAQTQINAKASSTDLSAEATTRANADTALQQAIDTKASASALSTLNGVVNSQGTAIGQRALQTDLAAEITARTNADTAINNILGTYKSAAKADILGVVAMSSGVPSGAVMETGTNANGNYYKFANGLLVCTYLTGPTNVASGAGLNVGPRTFAAGFSSAPIVALHVNCSFPYRVSGNCEPNVTPTTVSYSLLNEHGASLSIYSGFIAVGRWN